MSLKSGLLGQGLFRAPSGAKAHEHHLVATASPVLHYEQQMDKYANEFLVFAWNLTLEL